MNMISGIFSITVASLKDIDACFLGLEMRLEAGLELGLRFGLGMSAAGAVIGLLSRLRRTEDCLDEGGVSVSRLTTCRADHKRKHGR